MYDVKSTNRDAQLAMNLNAEYLASMGLCVLPEYSGHGLGKAMMLAAIGVCKHQQLPMFLCVLSSKITQHIATELGFTLLKSVAFCDDDQQYYSKALNNIASSHLCVMMIKT